MGAGKGTQEKEVRMHLSINISEDQELRKFIKGLIKEQVKSVMRGGDHEF